MVLGELCACSRLITIFREIRDPRDFNARHDLSAMLFIALAATLCGAKSCVDIADFAEANESDLNGIVDLAHGAPSHDCFSRLFRLLDPDELSRALAASSRPCGMPSGLGAPGGGWWRSTARRQRGGYERGRAFMPPLLVSVWDAETRLSITARAAPGGNEVAATLSAPKSVDFDGMYCYRRRVALSSRDGVGGA